MFAGEDTKDEVQLRREADEENGNCSETSRGVESSSSAAALSANPKSFRTGPEDEKPANLSCILWLRPLQ